MIYRPSKSTFPGRSTARGTSIQYVFRLEVIPRTHGLIVRSTTLQSAAPDADSGCTIFHSGAIVRMGDTLRGARSNESQFLFDDLSDGLAAMRTSAFLASGKVMASPALQNPSEPVAATDEAHLAMFNPAVMVAGQTMYLATTVAIYFFYRSVVPAADMKLWSVIATTGLACAISFCLAFIVRRPAPAEILSFWRKIDKRLTHVFDLIAVSAIFLLFPHGTEAHRLVALAYCVGYGPMQLITDPENLWANRISVVAILGAFSLQLFRMQHDAALVLSIMFALYGALLIFAAGLFHQSFVATVNQKFESQRAEANVRIALAEVAASRDAKTKFIASASHDLGQPLQAASLFLRNIKSQPDKAPDIKSVNALGDAINSAQAMIAHMLHYLRLEADAVQPNLVDTHVNDVIASVAALRLPQANGNQVAMTVVQSSWQLRTDPTLLFRAIDNLVGNALQHSGCNRLLIGVKSAGPDHKRIWVMDDGRGVPSAEHHAVFDDFVQSTNATGGFGLGLASVRRIAKLLGGSSGIHGRWLNGCAVYIEMKSR
jgi:signal transduction histidine kinase